MSPEVQARMFEPFFSTKGESGSGLGLAMAFGGVESHGGQIGVDSTPGRGTRVRLSFPLPELPRVVTVPEEPLEQTVPEKRRLRILAVDDEPTIGQSVRRALRPDGHVVVVATSGEEAVEQLANESFDVLLSDVGMGAGMNGWELAGLARRGWPDLPIVLATGWGAAIDPLDARAKGVDAVLAKPYLPEDLRRVVNACTRGPRSLAS